MIVIYFIHIIQTGKKEEIAKQKWFCKLIEMIEITEVKYGEWGNCLRMSDGKNELFATLDFGPRIIRFAAIGAENVFYEDVDKNITKEGLEEDFAKAYGADKGVWYIRGGHRMWISPEAFPRTYYPDNQPVAYEKIENGVKLIPPAQVTNNVQFEIEITMPEENCVHLVHKVTNVGYWGLEIAPWALSVLAAGGVEIFPVPDRETGFLENRHLVLWPYAKMNDNRVTWGDKYITLRQDKNCTCNYKIGQLSQHGWAAYFNHGDVFVKYFDTAEDKPHPDRNCNFETFTSEYMLEMESLGEFKKIEPGESISHSECWCFFKDVKVPETEEEMDAFAKKYIED